MKKKYMLMLESDENDRELSQHYFKDYGIDCRFLERSNEVIPFLDCHNPYELPLIVLLSMKSVPDTGLDILKKIKSKPHFRHIPVVMLGENTQEAIIKQCYAEGAASCINKPFSDRLVDVKIRSFLQYWFEVSELANTGVSLITS
ncbi:MAG: response regulator [Bacteroidia bacterium]